MRVARAPTGVESHKDRGDILRESSILCLGLKRFLFHPNLPSAELLLDQWCTRKCVVEINDSQKVMFFFWCFAWHVYSRPHSLNLEGRCWDRLSRDWGAKAMHLAGSVRNPSPRQGLDAKHFVADGDRLDMFFYQLSSFKFQFLNFFPTSATLAFWWWSLSRRSAIWKSSCRWSAKKLHKSATLNAGVGNVKQRKMPICQWKTRRILHCQCSLGAAWNIKT